MARFAIRQKDSAQSLGMARFDITRYGLPPLPPAVLLRELPDDDGGALEPSQGPGWYESSRDLRRGLDVREGLPADALLDEWLGACFAA